MMNLGDGVILLYAFYPFDFTDWVTYVGIVITAANMGVTIYDISEQCAYSSATWTRSEPEPI